LKKGAVDEQDETAVTVAEMARTAWTAFHCQLNGATSTYDTLSARLEEMKRQKTTNNAQIYNCCASMKPVYAAALKMPSGASRMPPKEFKVHCEKIISLGNAIVKGAQKHLLNRDYEIIFEQQQASQQKKDELTKKKDEQHKIMMDGWEVVERRINERATLGHARTTYESFTGVVKAERRSRSRSRDRRRRRSRSRSRSRSRRRSKKRSRSRSSRRSPVLVRTRSGDEKIRDNPEVMRKLEEMMVKHKRDNKFDPSEKIEVMDFIRENHLTHDDTMDYLNKNHGITPEVWARSSKEFVRIKTEPEGEARKRHRYASNSRSRSRSNSRSMERDLVSPTRSELRGDE
jgi:hypothetical protein